MIKTTLVIMAAGIGSRYGGGIKQLAKVGPSGEIIMDYSIHDALKAGFDKTVFIIRKDIEDDFREIIGKRIEKITDVDYAFQDINDLPAGYTVPAGRTKPWGTGQAILSIRGKVDTPFAAINADDYYGKEAYKEGYSYLQEMKKDLHSDKLPVCMVGFVLKNTLSDNGGVTRGICRVDESHMLTDIVETNNIVKTHDGAAVQNEDGREKIDVESEVSMNMWGLTPDFFEILEDGFGDFLKSTQPEDLKAEYLLPTIIGDLLKTDKVEVKVLQSQDKWFGVTYKEDKELVVNSIRELISQGHYQKR